MIILSNPTNIGYVNRFIHRRVRKLYIHCCPNDRLAEYDTWHVRNPQLIYVLLHLHTLTPLILWDLSACLVDIGKYYTQEDQEHFAEKRYICAYNLHCVIDEYLRDQMEMMEFN